MAGALRNHVAFDAAACESEVADQVEYLVADVFILKAQRAVLGTFGAENDGVLRARAADQSHVAELFLVGLIAEGACACDLGAIGVGGEVDAGLLSADGSGKVDGVLNAIAGAGIDSDELIPFADLDRLEHAHVFAAAALDMNALVEDGVDIGLSTAIEDR